MISQQQNIRRQIDSDFYPERIQQEYDHQTFFYTLTQYRPLCQRKQISIQHRPINDHQIQVSQDEEYPYFLVNNGWWKSFLGIIALNSLFVLAFSTFVLDTRAEYVDSQDPSIPYVIKYVKSDNYFITKALCIVSLVLINVTYILTQFLNPGIRNLSKLTQQELNLNTSQFCSRCNQYRTRQFTHCHECQVCIWKHDHHCGFFSKCIGGRAQTYSFYAFIISVAIGFIVLLICMSTELGRI